jgi:Tfp pilus assembly protein PilE
MIHSIKTKEGYALIELLFYISIFAILILVVINSMIVMTKSFRETTIQTELVNTSSIMERMSREIRQASSISSISTSNLVLNTTDEFEVDKTVEFSLSNSNIDFSEDGISQGNLNTPNIIISNLNFTEITTTEGKAIKILITLYSTNDDLNRNIDFYNTIALRGNY